MVDKICTQSLIGNAKSKGKDSNGPLFHLGIYFIHWNSNTSSQIMFDFICSTKASLLMFPAYQFHLVSLVGLQLRCRFQPLSPSLMFVFSFCSSPPHCSVYIFFNLPLYFSHSHTHARSHIHRQLYIPNTNLVPLFLSLNSRSALAIKRVLLSQIKFSS